MPRAKRIAEAAEFGSGPPPSSIERFEAAIVEEQGTDAIEDAMQGARGITSLPWKTHAQYVRIDDVDTPPITQTETQRAFLSDSITFANGSTIKVDAAGSGSYRGLGVDHVVVHPELMDDEADSAVIGRVPDDEDEDDEIEVEVPDPECEVAEITDAEIDELAEDLADAEFETRATVDGTEARIVSAPPLIEVTESLPEAIAALADAREMLEIFAVRAKEAAAEKKEAQERLNACVERVIRALERERQPGLFA